MEIQEIYEEYERIKEMYDTLTIDQIFKVIELRLLKEIARGVKK